MKYAFFSLLLFAAVNAGAQSDTIRYLQIRYPTGGFSSKTKKACVVTIICRESDQLCFLWKKTSYDTWIIQYDSRTFVSSKEKAILLMQQQEVPHASGRTTQVRFTEKQRLAIQQAATLRGIVGGHVLAKYIRNAVEQALQADGIEMPQWIEYSRGGLTVVMNFQAVPLLKKSVLGMRPLGRKDWAALLKE